MTSVEQDPTIPTELPSKSIGELYGPERTPNAIIKLPSGIKVLEDGLEHGGKFYFLRAFWTIFGGLLAWTVWVLIPVAVATVVILLAGGLGAMMPDDDPVGEPGSDFSLTCDPATELC